ncbi:MAG: hypothetical protein EPO21_15095 [Chloroflexota bacterium]|nr:MAG: hypothetical protein EPO21_15095 [Chloroflexota bacterium]
METMFQTGGGDAANQQRRPRLVAAELAQLSIADLEQILADEKTYNEALPSGEELTAFFEGLITEQLEAYAIVLAQRLRSETEVLTWFESEGLDPLALDLAQLDLPFPVQLVTPEQAEIIPAQLDGRAWYRGGTIFVNGALPTLRERLARLATQGILGNDLFHEVYHGFQDGLDKFHSLEEVLEALHTVPHEWRVALAEVHAWAFCLRGFKEETLIPILRNSYNVEDVESLVAAFEIIHSLAALGLDGVQIASLIGKTRWDVERKRYTYLEQVRDELMAEQGYSQGELEHLTSKKKLIERIQAVRAMGLARELCRDWPEVGKKGEKAKRGKG